MAPALVEEQGQERGRCGQGAAEGARGGPAGARALDDGVRQAAHQHDDQELPDGVQPAGPGRAGLGYEARGADEGGQPDRQVEPEDRPPADTLDEHPAHHRAHRHRDAHDRAPDSYGPGTLAGRGEGVGDDGHGHRVEHRGTDRLDDAEGDEPAEVGRQSAQQRAEGEESQAGLEDAAAAEPVPGGAGEHQQRGQHDQVGVGGPLQPGQRTVQIALHGGQCHVEHRVVEVAEEDTRATDRQHQRALPAGEFRLSGHSRAQLLSQWAMAPVMFQTAAERSLRCAQPACETPSPGGPGKGGPGRAPLT